MKKTEDYGEINNNFDFNDNIEDSDRGSYESRPQEAGYDIFYLRNNPEPLIEEFYLYLTNQRKNSDFETMHRKPYVQIKGTNPLLNRQGVRDLVQYMRTFVNSHTVQTNLTEASLQRNMRFLSDDLAQFMVDSIEEWDVELRYVRAIHNQLVGKCDLFLRRGLEDKEREHYSQEQRHEYSHSNNNDKKKKTLSLPSFITNMGRH